MVELSIIIPVYKTEKYIRECVDSVLREAPENSEIILVDDGSPDNSPKICDEYALKNKRVKVIHKENGGLSDARNVGISVAEGKKIFFIDSDDFVPNGYFSKMLAYDSDLIIGNYSAFFEDGTPNITGYVHLEKYNEVSDYLKDFHYYFATLFNFAWGKIYRKDIIIDNELRFSKNVSMVEDVLFNIEYYKHCKTIQIVSDAMLCYRQLQGSLSRVYSPKVFDWYVLSYKHIEILLKEYKSFTKENEVHLYSHFVSNAIECIVGFWKQPKKAKLEKYKEICNNEFLINALPYAIAKRSNKRILTALKNKSIKRLNIAVKNYLFWLNLKKKIRRFL